MIQYQNEAYSALFTHISIGPLFDLVSKGLVVHEFIVRDDFGGSQALQVLHKFRQVFTSSGRALQFFFFGHACNCVVYTTIHLPVADKVQCPKSSLRRNLYDRLTHLNRSTIRITEIRCELLRQTALLAPKDRDEGPSKFHFLRVEFSHIRDIPF